MENLNVKGYRQNVLAIIFNEEGKVLVGQNRGWGRDWTFIKGGIEKGESKKSALYREIYEEVGLKEDTLEIIYEYKKTFKKDFSPEELKWKIENKNEYYKGKKDHIFIVFYNGGGKINLGITNELIDYKRISVNEIGKYIKNDKLLSIIDVQFLTSIINNANQLDK